MTIAPPDSILLCDSTCIKRLPKAGTAAGGFFDQVQYFFSHLFKTNDWPPRWHCGIWTDFHGWLYIGSDMVIWAAYFTIPLLIFKIIRRRSDVPFPKVLWFFILFILFCGLTHLLDAVIFWLPLYRVSALLRLVTAVVSIITVWVLYKTLPCIYRLRTLAQLEAEIEERKKAEAASHRHQMQHEAAVELMAKKDHFMTVASHELKTPVTSVKAVLEVLEKVVHEKDELNNLAPLVTRASRQVGKLTSIINELIDVSAIQDQRLKLHQSEFKLVELIEEAIQVCQVTGQKRQVRINGSASIAIYGDYHRLEQVLCNLLNNAFKYSDVHLPVEVSFELSDEERVRVSVKDHGIGIPESKVPLVFDRFFRVEETSQNYSGVGLGLFISAEIVKMHGGEIGVESSPQKGSTFWFELPVKTTGSQKEIQ